MTTNTPKRVGKLNLYRVRIVAGGKVHTWERYGRTLAGSLRSARDAAVKEFGRLDSIAICGEQGDTGVYAF